MQSATKKIVTVDGDANLGSTHYYSMFFLIYLSCHMEFSGRQGRPLYRTHYHFLFVTRPFMVT